MLLDFEPAVRANRLTVLLRGPLWLPHALTCALGMIAASVLAMAGWAAALVLGGVPQPLRAAITALVGYWARAVAYSWLLTDRYPTFSSETPELLRQLDAEAGHSSRLSLLVRPILSVPAVVLGCLVALGTGWLLVVAWISRLLWGRMPSAQERALERSLQFLLRTACYLFMLTPKYPGGLFAAESASPVAGSSSAGAPPPRLRLAATIIVVMGLLTGVGGSAAAYAIQGSGNNQALLTLTARIGVATAERSLGAAVSAAARQESSCSRSRSQLHCYEGVGRLGAEVDQ